MGSPVVARRGLRDPGETTAWWLLAIASVGTILFLLVMIVVSYGAWLVFIVMFLIGETIVHAIARAHLRTNAIRVSEAQLPEIHAAVKNAATRLEMPTPDCFVIQETVWNAMAVRLVGQQMVVLYSGVVDPMLRKKDGEALAWIVSHEVGHVAAGHLDLGRTWVHLGGWLPLLAFLYSRKRELTADRIAHYVSGSLASGQRSLTYLSVGEECTAAVDIPRAVEQWRMHRGEFAVLFASLFSTHPPLLSRIEHLASLPRSTPDVPA